MQDYVTCFSVGAQITPEFASLNSKLCTSKLMSLWYLALVIIVHADYQGRYVTNCYYLSKLLG